MAQPATKAALVARARGMYDALDASFAPLLPAQMAIPGVNGAWSVKDTIAHLTYWDRSLLTYLDCAATGSAPRTPAGTGGDDEIWNARCYRSNHDRALDDILADLWRVRRAILARLDAIPEAAFFDADRFAWRTGSPLWEAVDETEDGHYPEHIAQIERWRAQHQTPPATQADVLWRVADWHAALHALTDAVPPGQMIVPGVNSDWSVKDEVAHLAYWLDAASARLEAAAHGTEPEVTNPTEAEIDRRNAACLAASQASPTNDVLEGYDAAYARLVAAIRALPEAALFDANRYAWTEGVPLVAYVAGNTWEHYPEHATQIRRWLAAGGA